MNLQPVTQKDFGNMMLDLWRNENDDIFMTSEQIGSALEYSDPIRSITNLYHRNAHRLADCSVVTRLITTDGKSYEMRVFNEKGIYEIIRKSNQPKADEFYDWVYKVLHEIRTTGSYSLSQPQSIEDLIIMQAQSMKELRQQVKEVSNELQIHKHRIDSLDRIDIDGDSQQRLNKMIQKYAHQEGLTFQKAWRDFTDRFNTAFHTNLTARIANYKEKHSLKDLTRPQFLSIIGELEDAIRVADKMLNPVEV